MNTQYENVPTVLGKDMKITTLQDTQVYNDIYKCDPEGKKIPNSYPGHYAFDIRTYDNAKYINNFGCDLEVLSCEKSSTSANGIVLKAYAKQYDKTFVLVHCALDTKFSKGAIIAKCATICKHLENHVHIYILMGKTIDTNKRIAGAMGQYLVWESPWFGMNSLLKDNASTSTPPPQSTPRTFKAVRSGKSSDNGTFYFDEKYYNDFKDKKQQYDAKDTTGANWKATTTWTEVYAPTGGSSTQPPTTFKATYLGNTLPEDNGKQFTFANEYKSAFGSVGVKQAISRDVKDSNGTTWYEDSTFRRDN